MSGNDIIHRDIAIDEQGYLLYHTAWSEDVARHLAQQEHLELTDPHWEVIHYLRHYYEKHQIAPMIRILMQNMGKKYGKEKGSAKYLFDLFPGGPAKQACKIAGLPKPTGCI